VMGNSDELLERIEQASERSGEKVWPLPLWEEYADHIKSDIADFKNVGNRTAGAIVGGVFLSKFVNDTPWVHLDIAGPAWQDKGKPYTPKGATGFGVRLLIELLAGWQQKPRL
ncbi:MAG TPA: leucyl aminopeptidase, partial [Thermodesulfobacteriota bacterium]|nr:leucyl aminopeptidase [Thermodesulfobacteriota bacterium]